ncbi:MAG: matrixin family metalloprotease [Bryobacterales bacterium]|nr:matrixin family metalloprotease [Bryobacterales bacterium]
MTRRFHPRLPLRACLAFLGLFAAIAPLPAYYHFLHVREQNGALSAIPERFDLRALPDGAVPLIVSRPAEPELADGDTWDAVISEVKLAASKWSSVPYSRLRLRYAGEVAEAPPAGTPYVEVVFEELPPGVIAMGGPVTVEARSSDEAGEFVPIARSVVMVNHQLVDRPSFSEAFFMTLIHEMGHAIGLQHSFTGSVMSTGVTRATTKAAPLAEDDYAGLASLYPGTHFAADTGTLRGRVTVDGAGTHLANVTALQPSGVAVSSLTLPDGSYEIRGLPPGSYYLYTQPLPPGTQEGLGPGQTVLPKNDAGETLPAGALFATRFFPGAADWDTAYLLNVRRGGVLNEITLDTPRVDSRAFTGVTTYSFPANFAVNPAVIDTSKPNPFLVAYGPNLVENGQIASGLVVDALGAGIPEDTVRPYEPAPEFLRAGLSFHPFSTVSGTKPLLFRRNGETFVQPAGFRLVGQQPPDLKEAALEAGANGADTVRLRGQQLASSFTYLFDGFAVPGTAGSDPVQEDREILLRVPFTNDGRTARIAAFTTDGQSSLYLNADTPAIPTRAVQTAAFHLQAARLPAGAEMRIELESSTPWFSDGQIGISFNTPHVAARGIWRSPDGRLVANVKAMPATPPGSTALWLHKDMATVNSGTAIEITSADPRTISIDSRIVDLNTGDTAIYPGATALLAISGEGLGERVSIHLADRILDANRMGSGIYRLAIPSDLPLGVTRLEAVAPGHVTLPIAVEVAGAPPVIQSEEVITRSDSRGTQIEHRAKLLVSLPGASPDELGTARLTVRVNGLLIEGVQQSAAQDNQLQVAFDLPAGLTTQTNGQEPAPELRAQVEWKGRHSAPRALSLGR